MTYGEKAFIWLRRILLALLVICIAGMAITSIARAKKACAQTDAYIRYLDSKYGW